MASSDGGQPSQGAVPPPQPTTYVSMLKQQQNQISTHPKPTVPMKQMEILHGEPTFIWDSTDIDNMVVRANLQHAVVGKFPYGMPEFKEIQKQIPLQCEFKGECKVGFLDSRHVLIRCSILADYIHLLSRSGFSLKIQNIYTQMKTLKWTKRFNSKEETSTAIAWISFPNLPPQFFIPEAIFSIATAVGRPLQVDAATRNETRPSCAKVKVELDLLKEHPQRVRIGDRDAGTGEVTMIWVKIQYDYLPKYCKECRLQGHDEKECFVPHPELVPAQDDVEKSDEGNRKMVKAAGTLQTDKGGEPSKQVNNGRKFITPKINPNGWIIKTDRRRPIRGTILSADTTKTGQATTSKNAFEALAAIRDEDVIAGQPEQADEAHAQVHNEAKEDAMQQNMEEDEPEVSEEEFQDSTAVTKKLPSPNESENEDGNSDYHVNSLRVLTDPTELVERGNKQYRVEEPFSNKQMLVGYPSQKNTTEKEKEKKDHTKVPQATHVSAESGEHVGQCRTLQNADHVPTLSFAGKVPRNMEMVLHVGDENAGVGEVPGNKDHASVDVSPSTNEPLSTFEADQPARFVHGPVNKLVTAQGPAVLECSDNSQKNAQINKSNQEMQTSPNVESNSTNQERSSKGDSSGGSSIQTSPSPSSYALSSKQELELMFKLDSLMKLHGTRDVTVEIAKKLSNEEYQIILKRYEERTLSSILAYIRKGLIDPPEELPQNKATEPTKPMRVQPTRSSKSNSKRRK